MSALALLLAALAAQTPAPVVPPPTIPPATLDDTLEVDRRRVDAKLIADADGGGRAGQRAGPFRFIVDSGADRTVIGAALAAGSGCRPSGR